MKRFVQNRFMAISNAQIKLLQSLKLKKFRQKYGKYFVEGPKMVEELMLNKPDSIDTVFGTADYLEKLSGKANKFKVVEVDERSLKKVSELKTPNQVIAIANLPNLNKVPQLRPSGVSIFLDRIQDPGNLGTIIRIADWFGIKDVVCSVGTVDAFSPKVIQSTMGAIYRVNVSYTAYEDLIGHNDGIQSFGAVLDTGSSIYSLGDDFSGILVIGNESQGISSDLQAKLNHLISIPRITAGGSESLNAAVACGIICGQLIKP